MKKGFQRFKFCPDGFFINDDDGIILKWIAFDSIQQVWRGSYVIEIETHDRIVKLEMGKMPECLDLRAYADKIMQHWMEYRERPRHELAARLAEVVDAIRHLPTVEIAGEEVQEAGESFAKKVKVR
jgi:hypothetical protein